MPPARESHSARDFALLYSPPSQHVVLEALFGIEREVFESIRPGIDHQVAHSRLQWWREECARTLEGRPLHPLTRTLVEALRSEPSSRLESSSAPETALPALRGLAGFVDVATWDLASATFETRRELTAYCERWASAMIEPLAGVGSASIWRTIGATIREIELLSDLAREAHYGRLRFPLDELDRTKASLGTLAKPPWPAALAEILRARQRALRNEISAALSRLGGEPQPMLRGLLVWVALAWRSSSRAERALPDRLRPGRFDALSDAWFAWRVARKAMVGRLRLS
jgi:15-cis-phytoene synthase